MESKIEKEIENENKKIKRKLTLRQKKVVTVFAIIFSIFQLITIFNPLNIIQQRITHLMFGLVLIFTLNPMFKSKDKKLYFYDYIIIGLAIFSCSYIALQSKALMMEKLGIYNNLDVLVSIVIIVLVLEATRRMFGWIMPTIAIVALLYAYFGKYIPGLVGHRGYSVYRISTTLSLWTEGILGSPLGVSSTYVAVFVIFGAFLQTTNIGQFLVRVAYAGFGKVRGGPAKASIVASGLMGSVSGSAVANVVGTGTFTIPLMKKVGFKAEFAGAVESVASSGGQLMPPIMGATAFIMAEMVGVPYSEILIAALIPALLYYMVLYYTVDIRSARLGLKGEKKENLENWRLLLKEDGFLLLPLGVLIFSLVVLKLSTGRSAIYGIIAVIIVSLLNKRDRLTKERFFKALEDGGYAMLDIVAVTAMAGIISGVLSLTGMGLKVSGLLVNVANGNLLILLLLSMVVSIIAGMGLPIVACYLLLGVLVAPALVSMGVQVLSAHLFIFLFGIFSAITPPVAIAAYVAGGIAGADPMKTGFVAWKLALPIFLLPFAFVYEPALIMIGDPLTIIVSLMTITIGLFCFSSALEGYIWKFNVKNIFLRLLLGAGGILMIMPDVKTDIMGIALIGLLLVILFGIDKKTAVKA